MYENMYCTNNNNAFLTTTLKCNNCFHAGQMHCECCDFTYITSYAV